MLDSELVVVNQIADNLARFGDTRAAEPLLCALRERPFVGCISGLARLRDPRAIAPTVACLYDDTARRSAIDTLRSFGSPSISDLIRVLVRIRIVRGFEAQSWISACAAAATLLGELGWYQVLLPLCWALSDEQAEVRLAAAEALASLPPPAASVATPVLIELLADEHWFFAERATSALLRIGEPAATALIEAVESTQSPPIGRRRAVELLGSLRDTTSLPLLASLAASRDPQLRWAAVRALERIGGPAMLPNLTAYLADDREEIRSRAIAALAQLGAPTVKPLVSALADRNPRVRAAPARAMCMLGRSAVDCLRRIASGELEIGQHWL